MIDMPDYLGGPPSYEEPSENITLDNLAKIFKLMDTWFVELKSGELHECILQTNGLGTMELVVRKCFDGTVILKVTPKLVETLLGDAL